MNNKIIRFFKKYQLIISLALIAGLLLGYKLLFFQTSVQPPRNGRALPNPSPYPILTPTDFPNSAAAEGQGIEEKELVKEILNQFPLSRYLPYPGKEFSLRYTAPLTLEITEKEPTSTARQKILDWIYSKGIDLQTHKIIWK